MMIIATRGEFNGSVGRDGDLVHMHHFAHPALVDGLVQHGIVSP